MCWYSIFLNFGGIKYKYVFNFMSEKLLYKTRIRYPIIESVNKITRLLIVMIFKFKEFGGNLSNQRNLFCNW